MKTWLKILGVVVLAALIVGGWSVDTIARQQATFMIHQTDRAHARQTPADYELAYESITLTTRDGIQLAAWYVPSKNGAAVIAQHGYRLTREEMLKVAVILARHGYGALLMDARDHGDSGGDTITFGLKEVLDIRAGLDYLLQRPDVSDARIGAVGNSQGAVTLLLATAQYPEIKAYAGNSPYANLPDEIASGVHAFTGLPAFPFAPLIQYYAERGAGFSANLVAPIHHIAEIAPRPVFLMQGGQDTFIPTDSGQRLYDAAKGPRQLWFDPDVRHTEFLTQRPDEYERRVIGFLDQYLSGK